jgi:hypothetical protein
MQVPAVEADAPAPALRRLGLLYSLLLLAAMSLIVFSVVGIATMTQLLPDPLSNPTAAPAAAPKPVERPAPQTRGVTDPRDARPARSCPDCDASRG